jgi:hypothetical protein
MPRKKKPHGWPPKVYPMFRCIGGPLDGEIRSEIDFENDRVHRIADPSRSPSQGGTYVRQRRLDGSEIWQWTEIESVD